MKSIRINTGIYDVEYKNRKFYVERVSSITMEGDYVNDNSWQVVECTNVFKYEYWQHFSTKRECLIAIQTVVDSE